MSKCIQRWAKEKLGVRVSCKCGKAYIVDDLLVGKKVKCPDCRTDIFVDFSNVPVAEAEQIPVVEVGTSVPPSSNKADPLGLKDIRDKKVPRTPPKKKKTQPPASGQPQQPERRPATDSANLEKTSVDPPPATASPNPPRYAPPRRTPRRHGDENNPWDFFDFSYEGIPAVNRAVKFILAAMTIKLISIFCALVLTQLEYTETTLALVVFGQFISSLLNAGAFYLTSKAPAECNPTPLSLGGLAFSFLSLFLFVMMVFYVALRPPEDPGLLTLGFMQWWVIASEWFCTLCFLIFATVVAKHCEEKHVIRTTNGCLYAFIGLFIIAAVGLGCVYSSKIAAQEAMRLKVDGAEQQVALSKLISNLVTALLSVATAGWFLLYGIVLAFLKFEKRNTPIR